MRAAIVSALLDREFGGPAFVVRGHAEALRRRIQVDVYGMSARVTDGSESWIPDAAVFPRSWPAAWFRARGLRSAMHSAAANWDVIHAHMLWDHPVWCAWRVARARRIPLILTPHGSVNTVWRRRGAHKSLYRRVVLDPMLDDTAFIHALNRREEAMLRDYGVRAPIRVIPNGLPRNLFGEAADPDPARLAWPAIRNRRVLLYLGRLNADKGLDVLVDAWAELGSAAADWILVIAGPDSGGFEQILRARIAATRSAPILLTGEVSGDLKRGLFAAASCFVLPSRSEGLSMSLIEAMAARLPSVYTAECNLPELSEAGGGWEVAGGFEPLVEALRLVVSRSEADLRSTGERACGFGLRQYTLERVATLLLQMYCDALGGRAPAAHLRDSLCSGS